MRRSSWLVMLMAVSTGAVAFFFYGLPRSWHLGFDPGRSVPFAAFSAIPAVLPSLLMAGAAALWILSRREFKWPRHAAGTRCCRRCGYPALASPAYTVCAECGGSAFLVTRAPPNVATVRRAMIVADALLVGWVAAECWMHVEEWCFAREAAATGMTQWDRGRWWPFSNSQLYFEQGGIRASD